MPENKPELEGRHEVRIHIDQKPHESPNPTTGEALYALGKVSAGFELYREVSGDREDRPIPKGPETVHLKENEHFHSGPAQHRHEYHLVVDNHQHEWPKEFINGDE